MPNFNTAKNPSFAPPRPPREGDGDGDASPYSQVTAAEQVYAASPTKTVRRKKKKEGSGGITITGYTVPLEVNAESSADGSPSRTLPHYENQLINGTGVYENQDHYDQTAEVKTLFFSSLPFPSLLFSLYTSIIALLQKLAACRRVRRNIMQGSFLPSTIPIKQTIDDLFSSLFK